MADDAHEADDSFFVPTSTSTEGTFGESVKFPTQVLPDGKVLLTEAIRSLCGKSEGLPFAEIVPARVLEVLSPVQSAIVNGHVRVECLADDGARRDVEATVFGNDGVWSAAIWNPSALPLLPGASLDRGRLIVSGSDLVRFVPVGRSFGGVEPSQARYIPPLLAYVLELAERFDLSPNYKFNKVAMQEAISKLVDEEPALPIGTKVASIATFLGHPAFEGGGGGPGKGSKTFASIVEADEAGINKDRPPRPDASYLGVTYPRPRKRRRGELGGLP